MITFRRARAAMHLQAIAITTAIATLGCMAEVVSEGELTDEDLGVTQQAIDQNASSLVRSMEVAKRPEPPTVRTTSSSSTEAMCQSDLLANFGPRVT